MTIMPTFTVCDDPKGYAWTQVGEYLSTQSQRLRSLLLNSSDSFTNSVITNLQIFANEMLFFTVTVHKHKETNSLSGKIVYL